MLWTIWKTRTKIRENGKVKTRENEKLKLGKMINY